MKTNRKSHQKIFYDLSEPISEDDPPKNKRLKQSFETEHQGDMLGGLVVLLFALALLMNYPPAKDRWVSATPGATS